MSLPRMKDVARGSLTPKERKISEKKEVLGVCLIGKRTSSGSFRAVCSGSVVRDLLEYDGCSEKVFIITSDHIVLKEDLGELQSGRKALNTGDYRLYFKIWDSANKLKMYELHKVTNSKDKVQFISGLAIIALDAKKLRKRSGILSYRPFTANKEATECLGGSVCQIVDGNTDAFAVTPYDLESMKESGKYVLKLPEKRVIIKTWSELTGKGVSNLHPCGAVILRSGGAVGVLIFVDDKISPVLLSQLQPFGAVGTSAKQDWIPAEGSVVDQGDVFSNCGQLQDLDFVEDASICNGSLTEGSAGKGGGEPKTLLSNRDKSPDKGGIETETKDSGPTRRTTGDQKASPGTRSKRSPEKETGAVPKRTRNPAGNLSGLSEAHWNISNGKRDSSSEQGGGVARNKEKSPAIINAGNHKVGVTDRKPHLYEPNKPTENEEDQISAREGATEPQTVADNEYECLDKGTDKTSNEDKRPAEETTVDHEVFAGKTERIPPVKIADKTETRDNGLAGTNTVDHKVSPMNRDQSSDKVEKNFHDLEQMQLDAGKVTDKTNLTAYLEKIASDKGYEISDNQGSGDCMFYALSDQLELVNGKKISHGELRKSIVQYLKNNPNLRNGTERFDFVCEHDRYPSWDDYLRKMEQPGTWGDHVILHAAASNFEIPIKVISSLSHGHDQLISPEQDVNSNKQLVVGHVDELHYVSLRPKSSTRANQDQVAAKRSVLDPKDLCGNEFGQPMENQDCVEGPCLISSYNMAKEALCATDEKANFQRLSRLLVCGGITLLREVFDCIHPPANLAATLNNPATKAHLQRLRDHKKVITQLEWKWLYPSPGMCGKSTDFDISLLFKLFRNICALAPPVTGWNRLPNNTDHSREADIVRIRFYRNEVYSHSHDMEISDTAFVYLWRDISEALLRIAHSISSAKRDEWEKAINEFLREPLTLDEAQGMAELKSWYKKEMDTNVEKLTNEVKEMKTMLEKLNPIQTHEQANNIFKMSESGSSGSNPRSDCTKMTSKEAKTKDCSGGNAGEVVRDGKKHENQENGPNEKHSKDGEGEQNNFPRYTGQAQDHQIVNNMAKIVTEIRQTQEKDHQTLANIRQNQEEDRQTLQETLERVKHLEQSGTVRLTCVTPAAQLREDNRSSGIVMNFYGPAHFSLPSPHQNGSNGEPST